MYNNMFFKLVITCAILLNVDACPAAKKANLHSNGNT